MVKWNLYLLFHLAKLWTVAPKLANAKLYKFIVVVWQKSLSAITLSQPNDHKNICKIAATEKKLPIQI